MEFSRRHKIPRSSTYTISEKAIRFRHPDYDPDRAQKLISSSMSRHLSTRNISSKSTHTFLSNLANRQTDRQTRAKTYTCSLVEGNNNDDTENTLYVTDHDKLAEFKYLCKFTTHRVFEVLGLRLRHLST